MEIKLPALLGKLLQTDETDNRPTDQEANRQTDKPGDRKVSLPTRMHRKYTELEGFSKFRHFEIYFLMMLDVCVLYLNKQFLI